MQVSIASGINTNTMSGDVVIVASAKYIPTVTVISGSATHRNVFMRDL